MRGNLGERKGLDAGGAVRSGGVRDEVVVVLARKLLERLALGLGEEEGREDARKHEEGEDLEDVGDKGVLASAVLLRSGKGSVSARSGSYRLGMYSPT